jgi:hypothetical protein
MWVLTTMLLLTMLTITREVRHERYLEGIAKAAFIAEHYKLDFPPEQARFFDIVITTTDVQLSIDQFTVLEGN